MKHEPMPGTKIFLVVMGALMLLGGGLCVGFDVAWVSMAATELNMLSFLIVLGVWSIPICISVLIALLGWRVIKRSGIAWHQSSIKRASSELDDVAENSDDNDKFGS